MKISEQKGGNVMKNWIAVAVSFLLIGLPLTAVAAENSAPAQQPVKNARVASGQSNVSQGQVENIKKREAARKQRDKKMKVREKNVQTNPTNSNNLFRTSK